MYKENNTKIKNIEEYKKSLTSYRAKLSLAKKSLRLNSYIS
jgi:hypothetical protein